AINFARIRQPGHKILIFEEKFPNDGLCDIVENAYNSFGTADIPTDRHTGYGNACFCDGHIDRVTPNDIFAHTGTNTQPIKIEEWYHLFK
ncbi:MAG TPA: hypothetical protein VLJ39_09265, partial [Tepidisphaeraceae bacterium]|nr:hypothetical protein [Tepidisphaeraceae bacterium]